MSANVPITFQAPKKLKTEFEAIVKDQGMTVSYVLRQLMSRFIDNPGMLVASETPASSELKAFKEEMRTTLRQYDKQFQRSTKLMKEASRILSQAQTEQQISLVDQIIGILRENSEVRLQKYEDIEEAILKTYPDLTPELQALKERGKNPVADAVNYYRDRHFVSYSIRSKKLTWRDINE